MGDTPRPSLGDDDFDALDTLRDARQQGRFESGLLLSLEPEQFAALQEAVEREKREADRLFEASKGIDPITGVPSAMRDQIAVLGIPRGEQVLETLTAGIHEITTKLEILEIDLESAVSVREER